MGEAERDHLILLGTVAGSPAIIMEAIESGNVFDPAHMDKAMAMKPEWEAGEEMIKQALEEQALQYPEIQPEIQPPAGPRQEAVVKSRLATRAATLSQAPAKQATKHLLQSPRRPRAAGS